MANQSDNTWRDSLPKTNYFDKATELAASLDRLMVTLYSALIAGIVVLLLKEEVTLWVGAPLVLALVCFVLGISHTLMHIAFMSKMLLLAEALVNGTEVVPNAVEDEEPTPDAYARNQAYAQRSYTSQLVYLLVGIGFGALAIVIRLWSYAWRAAVIGLCFVVFILVIVALIATWKNVVRRFRPSTIPEQKT